MIPLFNFDRHEGVYARGRPVLGWLGGIFVHYGLRLFRVGLRLTWKPHIAAMKYDAVLAAAKTFPEPRRGGKVATLTPKETP